MEEKTLEALKKTAIEGSQIRDLCKHSGFKIYLKALEDIILDKKNTWLRGSEEDAKNARLEAKSIQRALDELKKFIVSGDNAQNIINDTSNFSNPE
jgi:hypothetical protein